MMKKAFVSAFIVHHSEFSWTFRARKGNYCLYRQFWGGAGMDGKAQLIRH
jgi:hypothetical protein